MPAYELHLALASHPAFNMLKPDEQDVLRGCLHAEIKSGNNIHSSVFQFIGTSLSAFERMLLLTWQCSHFRFYRRLNAALRGEPDTYPMHIWNAFLSIAVCKHGTQQQIPVAYRASIVSDACFQNGAHLETWLSFTTEATLC